MPEIVDQDENFFYVRPDIGGPISPVAKTPETSKMFGVENPGAPMGELPTVGAAGITGAAGPTEHRGVAPADMTDPTVAVTNTSAPPPMAPGVTVTHSPDATDLAVESAERTAGRMPLPVPAGEQPPAAQQQQAPTPGGPAPATTSAPAPGGGTSKAQRDYFAALEDQKDAERRLMGNAEQAANERAFQMAVEANAAEKFAAGQEARARQREIQIKQETDKLDELNKAVRDGKEDPDRYFKDRGVGARIGWAIAVGLSQFGAQLAGGPNTAMQLLNSEIESDMEAQRAEIRKKGEAVDAQKNKIAMLRQMGMDEVQADHAAYLGGLEASRAKLNATIASTDSDVVRANGQKLLAQIDAQIAERKMQFAAATAKKVSLSEQLNLARFQMDQDKERRGRMVRLADGSMALAPTIEDATKIKESDENRIAMTENIQRLKQIVKEKTAWDGKTSDEAKRIASDLITQFGVMRKLGALSDSDRQLAEQFRDPTDKWTRDGKILDSLDKYELRINNGHNAMLKARLVQ